ncbi:MAG: ATP-dependent zinc metalloprotease FtsH [Bacillota bacterium]
MKLLRKWGFFIVIFVLVVAGFALFSDEKKDPELPYFDFVQQLNDGNIKTIEFDGIVAKVEFKDKTKVKVKDVEIPSAKAITNVTSSEQFMLLLDSSVKSGKLDKNSYTLKPPAGQPWWLSLLPTVLIIVIIIVFWMMFINGAQGAGGAGKAMSFGKSRAKLSGDGDKKKTFLDVAGAKEEKEELEEIVDFLKDPRKYVEIGARIPKGVLLIGPPGTGKTLLAKAVAGEANVPFFSISGSDFVEMFVGVGASRVRDLFDQAKKQAPSIVFIDEIDAVGRHRGAGLGGGHDEREQTLNQLLVEMDGFGVNEGVIILAATNRSDILDPALLRPGRFDRKVYVGKPDKVGREEILKVHARGKKFDEAIDLEDIAKTTPGFTGADLENLLNEAALAAAKKNHEVISNEDVKEANYKVMLGPEKKSRVMTDKDKRLTAYHEAGHALAVRLLSSTEKVDRVSIISVGQAGGYTAYKPSEDINYETRGHLLEYIMISLAGRAAEEIVFNEVTTGSYSDLKSSTGIARSMVTRFGMSEKIGPLVFEDENTEVFIGRDFGHTKNFSESIASVIDEEIRAIIDESYAKVLRVIRENHDKLVIISEALIEKERISAEEFEALFSGEETPQIESESGESGESSNEDVNV